MCILLLDNLQQDAECSLQFLGIIKNISKPNPDELDKSTMKICVSSVDDAIHQLRQLIKSKD